MRVPLTRYQWLSWVRSPALTQQIVQTVILVLFGLYLAANLVFLSLFATKIMKELYPQADPATKLGGLLIYGFFAGLLMRILFQKFSGLQIKPYLLLPVPKNKLIHYLLRSSLTSFFNWMPLFILLPYFIQDVLPNQSTTYAIHFLMFYAGFVLWNNYLAFSVDKLFKLKPTIAALPVILLIAVYIADHRGWISVSPFLERWFTACMQHGWLAALPLLGAVALYVYNLKALGRIYFLVDKNSNEPVTEMVIPSTLLGRLGYTGVLIGNEIRMIWRHKRSRSLLYIALLMILYPLIFMGNPVMDYAGFKVFLALFITGIFALNYGQLMLSWNSPHFDFLATRQVRIEDIFRAKYYILAGSCVVLFLVTLPYGWVYQEYLPAHIALFLYNIGFSIYVYMFLAAYNSKRIDPSKGAMMNYEGISIAHFFILLPLWGIPYLLYLVFQFLGPNVPFLIIGGLGMAGALFHTSIIHQVTKLFENRKYPILSAFRKKS